jgi:hypothetical protein
MFSKLIFKLQVPCKNGQDLLYEITDPRNNYNVGSSTIYTAFFLACVVRGPSDNIYRAYSKATINKKLISKLLNNDISIPTWSTLPNTVYYNIDNFDYSNSDAEYYGALIGRDFLLLLLQKLRSRTYCQKLVING